MQESRSGPKAGKKEARGQGIIRVLERDPITEDRLTIMTYFVKIMTDVIAEIAIKKGTP